MDSCQSMSSDGQLSISSEFSMNCLPSYTSFLKQFPLGNHVKSEESCAVL